MPAAIFASEFASRGANTMICAQRLNSMCRTGSPRVLHALNTGRFQVEQIIKATELMKG